MQASISVLYTTTTDHPDWDTTMASMITFSAWILLFPFTLCTSHGETEARVPNNTWKVANIRVSRKMSGSIPELTSPINGGFIVYRSIAKPCPVPGFGPVDDPLKSIIEPCGWRPSPVGTVCASDGKATDNGWRTCEGSTELPEGEQVSSIFKDKLKWRVVNITEDENTFGSLRAGTKKQGIPLRSVTFEVINVIPVSS
jgi:hypothetical protein